MIAFQRELEIRTSGQGFVDITAQVQASVLASQARLGLCTVFIQHTSASLLISENADPAVLRDLSRFMQELVPESRAWEHDDEGPDDMPAHVRALLSRTSENVPITGGFLALGTWQALYLWEHRRLPHTRKVVIHISGEA